MGKMGTGVILCGADGINVLGKNGTEMGTGVANFECQTTFPDANPMLGRRADRELTAHR